jgi:DNA cross-link repair 1A protein
MLGVDEEWVHPLPMDSTTVLPDTGGVEVTLIEANHCTSALYPLSFISFMYAPGPGSCLFLFSGKQTINAGDSSFHSPFVGTDRVFRYLHCGDFRACPEHVLHPSVMGKKLDLIYLDTTYLDPKVCSTFYSDVTRRSVNAIYVRSIASLRNN